MAHEIFITGATGFLGRRLLADMLRQTDCRFALLVRSPAAQALLSGSLHPADFRRIRFVQGDVTLPRLGLDSDAIAGLAASVREVWHLAASTSFDESTRLETFRVNVDGTRELLAVAARLPKLETLFHMSTAYVCGNKLGCIPEGPFDVPEGFKNSYEESKHQAEGIVRASGLPATILRPSIIMGDSRTGDNGGDDRMYYGYALGVLRAAMHLFGNSSSFWAYWRDNSSHAPAKNAIARLVGCPTSLKNCVTIDDVVSVCLAVSNCRERVGKTFNIVAQRSLTTGACLTAIETAIRVGGFAYDRNLSHSTLNRMSKTERAAFRYTRVYWPYLLFTDPAWETANVHSLRTMRVTMTEPLFEYLVSSFVAALAERACR